MSSPKRNIRIPLLPLLTALAAALVLVAVVVVFLGSRTPGDNSAEAGFSRDMAIHHAQAVEMAGILRDKANDDRMKTFAEDIILTQQGQIGQMQGWLAAWGLPMTSTEPQMEWMGHEIDGQMPGMATPKELNTLRNAPPEEAEKQFLELMIPHHEAALDMSDAILARTNRPEVQNLAQAIKDSQKAEIANMNEMLAARGGEAPETKDKEDHSNHSHEH